MAVNCQVKGQLPDVFFRHFWLVLEAHELHTFLNGIVSFTALEAEVWEICQPVSSQRRLIFNLVCTARQRSPEGDFAIPHSSRDTERPPGQSVSSLPPSACRTRERSSSGHGAFWKSLLGLLLSSSSWDSQVGFIAAPSH